MNNLISLNLSIGIPGSHRESAFFLIPIKVPAVEAALLDRL